MNIVQPVIRLIAKTVPVLDELKECEQDWFEGLDEQGPLVIVEFAGRECYQSWDRPNPLTSTVEDYVKNLITQKHFSVLEHVSATLRFKDVSRGLTHELIRHRHLSYSQLSQRYVPVDMQNIVLHPHVSALIAKELGDDAGSVNHFIDERIQDLTEAATNFYTQVASALGAEGKSIKERRGAARSGLPNMTATNIVVTGNLRAWRHFILTRSSVYAELEIRRAAYRTYELLVEAFPYAFFDFEMVKTDDVPMLISLFAEEG